MNRFFILNLFLCFSSIIYAQESVSNKFLLDAPPDWRSEQLNLPPRFAQKLDYKGVEYVRFSKGWGDKNSDEFWTFTYAWYLDEFIKISTNQLTVDLKEYFEGLFILVGAGKDIDKETITNATKIEFEFNEFTHQFIGSARVFDVFFNEAPISLNIKVIADSCKRNNKQIVYFRFSPKDFNHPLWKVMDNILIPCK